MAFHSTSFAFAPTCPASFLWIPPRQFSTITASIQSAATQRPTGSLGALHAADVNPPHPVFPVPHPDFISPQADFIFPHPDFQTPPNSRGQEISRVEPVFSLRRDKITLRKRKNRVRNDRNRVRRHGIRVRLVKISQRRDKIRVRRDVTSLRRPFDTENLQNHRNGGSTTNRH